MTTPLILLRGCEPTVMAAVKFSAAISLLGGARAALTLYLLGREKLLVAMQNVAKFYWESSRLNKVNIDHHQ